MPPAQLDLRLVLLMRFSLACRPVKANYVRVNPMEAQYLALVPPYLGTIRNSK
jgi:hypothetical protein